MVLTLGAGGTQRLARLVGLSRAKELIFTGRVLGPQEACEYNLVNKKSEESAFECSIEMAREIAKKGPVAIRMAKIACQYGLECDLSTGLKFEETCYAQGY